MDPVQTAVTAFLNAIQSAQQVQPGVSAPPQAALNALLGQDLTLLFQGSGPGGLQFTLPSGQTVTAQGEFPYPVGTQVQVRVSSDGGAVRLQTLQTLPPAPPAILAPLVQGEGPFLQARLTQAEPPPELEPLVQLFRLLGGAMPQEDAPASSGSPAGQAPAGSPAGQAASGSSTGQAASGSPAGQAASGSQPGPPPAGSPAGQAPAGVQTGPDPTVPEAAGPSPTGTQGAPASPQAASAGAPAQPGPSAAAPQNPLAPGTLPLPTGPAPSGPAGAAAAPQGPNVPPPASGFAAPAQPPVLGAAQVPSTLPLPAPSASQAASSAPPGAAAQPTVQDPATQVANGLTSMVLAQPSGAQAQLPAAEVLQALVRALPASSLQALATVLQKGALDPGAAQDLVARVQTALARVPDLPPGQGEALVQLLRNLVRAADPPAAGHAAQAPPVQATSPQGPASAAASPESWQAWMKAGMKALSDPAVSPREAPFHAAQAKEGTALYELPLPWSPTSSMQVWVEQDRQGKGKGAKEGGSTRVLLGLNFSRLGEVRLGLAKGPEGLQVRVWAQHPEALVAAQASMEAELKTLGTPVDLKILPLEGGDGGGIPSIRSLATGSTFQVLG